MAHVLTHRHIGHRDDERGVNTREHAIVDKDLQRSYFGGFHFGSAFFGWIVASGLATMLTALLAAIGSAVAITSVENVTSDTTSTVGLASGILLLIALGIAYYAGGYVAGRMARFDGARQGVGVWAMGIIVVLILGGLGALLGSQYNILQQLNLPRLPIDEGTLTTAGLTTLIAAVVVTLFAAIAGAKQGVHYHNKIDETGKIGAVEE